MDSQDKDLNEQRVSTSPKQVTQIQPKTPTSQNANKDHPNGDISGGWTKATILSSYLAGALTHIAFKPRGKASDVWKRGLNAVCKADNTIIDNWYICKRIDEEKKECNELFNLKLSRGNIRLRTHCDKHDQREKDKEEEKRFLISYDEMVSALDKANEVGDSYGLVSFRKFLPRPEVMGDW